jgi:hypothetical protein
LYIATKLGGNEARRQLDALDIVAGGALGVQRDKGSLEFWLQIDQMLGGLYFKSLSRSLNTRRNRHGLIEAVYFSIEIDETQLRNYGLTYPVPLDLIFLGETASTRGIIR